MATVGLIPEAIHKYPQVSKLHGVLAVYLVDKELHRVSNSQSALDAANVLDIATADLHVLHCKLHLLQNTPVAIT